MASELFERTVERATNQSIEDIRATPLDELRRQTEKRLGRPIRFVSAFPWVGRGNMLRDRLVSHEEAEAAYEYAIREL